MRGAIRAASGAIAFVLGIASMAIRLSHPELTETQLFLDYWWMMLATGLAALGYFVT